MKAQNCTHNLFFKIIDRCIYLKLLNLNKLHIVLIDGVEHLI
jgi:hypothetical protein